MQASRSGFECQTRSNAYCFFVAYKTSLGVRRVETNAGPKDVLMIDECDVSRFSL